MLKHYLITYRISIVKMVKSASHCITDVGYFINFWNFRRSWMFNLARSFRQYTVHKIYTLNSYLVGWGRQQGFPLDASQIISQYFETVLSQASPLQLWTFWGFAILYQIVLRLLCTNILFVVKIVHYVFSVKNQKFVQNDLKCWEKWFYISHNITYNTNFLENVEILQFLPKIF